MRVPNTALFRSPHAKMIEHKASVWFTQMESVGLTHCNCIADASIRPHPETALLRLSDRTLLRWRRMIGKAANTPQEDSRTWYELSLRLRLNTSPSENRTRLNLLYFTKTSLWTVLRFGRFLSVWIVLKGYSTPFDARSQRNCSSQHKWPIRFGFESIKYQFAAETITHLFAICDTQTDTYRLNDCQLVMKRADNS